VREKKNETGHKRCDERTTKEVSNANRDITENIPPHIFYAMFHFFFSHTSPKWKLWYDFSHTSPIWILWYGNQLSSRTEFWVVNVEILNRSLRIVRTLKFWKTVTSCEAKTLTWFASLTSHLTNESNLCDEDAINIGYEHFRF